MTLLRAAYRTMLASYFVSSGFKAVRNPAPLAPLAEPVAEKIVPLVKKYAPEQVAGFVPEDTETLVRLNGAIQLVGGLALATGKGRRVGALLLAGSLIPSTLAKYPFWNQTGDEKALSRTHFAKNVSILGGVLLASRDTEGQPGLAWRAQAGGQAIAKGTSKATKKLTGGGGSAGNALAKQAGHVSEVVSERAGELAGRSSDLAQAAVVGGAALLSAAEVKTRGSRKNAVKQFKQAQQVAAQQAKQAGVVAAQQAKQAREAAAQRAAEAKRASAQRAEAAREEARKQAEAAKKDAKKAGKKAGKRASKKAGRMAEQHLVRGEN